MPLRQREHMDMTEMLLRFFEFDGWANQATLRSLAYTHYPSGTPRHPVSIMQRRARATPQYDRRPE
jgi:hypothetical protein